MIKTKFYLALLLWKKSSFNILNQDKISALHFLSGEQRQDPRECLELWQRRVRLDFRKWFFPRGCQALSEELSPKIRPKPPLTASFLPHLTEPKTGESFTPTLAAFIAHRAQPRWNWQLFVQGSRTCCRTLFHSAT